MGIQVTCPNGHQLNVKDKYAGKAGLCPHCQSKVQVPVPARLLDDELIARLDLSFASRAQPVPEEEADSVLDDGLVISNAASGISLLGSSFVRRKKVCVHCGNLVSSAFTHCPRCGYLLASPEEPTPGLAGPSDT